MGHKKWISLIKAGSLCFLSAVVVMLSAEVQDSYSRYREEYSVRYKLTLDSAVLVRLQEQEEARAAEASAKLSSENGLKQEGDAMEKGQDDGEETGGQETGSGLTEGGSVSGSDSGDTVSDSDIGGPASVSDSDAAVRFG